MNQYYSESPQTIELYGGHGFIGRNIVELLGGRYHFYVPKREEVDLEHETMVMPSSDLVINCVNAKDNLQAFVNLSHFYNGDLIHMGTGAEYDKARPLVNVKESEFSKSIPKDKYGLDKYKVSRNIRWMHRVVCLRPFGVFGKYEDITRRFISKAIMDNLKGKKIIIYKNVKFSYVWVNDLVKILDYFILNKPKHRFYNVGGHQITLEEIASKIGKYHILRKGMANEYTCDDSRVREETGIKYTPIDESLKSLKEYYEKTYH